MLIISQQIDDFKPQALPPPELFVPPVLPVQPATSSCHTQPSHDDWENPPDPDAKPGPTKAGAIEMIYKPVKIRKWEKLSPEEARAVIVRSGEGLLRRSRNLCLSALIEAVRDQTRVVDGRRDARRYIGWVRHRGF